MQISVAPNSTASWTRAWKSSSVDVIGVRRAPALAEPAERAADDADVGEVDVAVDDEGRDVAGELGAELVGRLAHLLDHLRAGLGEQRGQLRLGQRQPVPATLDRPRRERRVDRAVLAPARALARDEAPVLELDDVEHPLLDPLGIEVLRVGAEALGQRVAARSEPLADLVRARERLLGRDVVAVRRQPPEVGRALVDQVEPPVGEIRRDLDRRPRASAADTRGPEASCPPTSPPTPKVGAVQGRGPQPTPPPPEA